MRLVQVLLSCLGGFVFTLTNLGLLSCAMALAEDMSPAAVWNERFRWLTPHYLAFGPLAWASAVAYEDVGIAGLAVFALPPALLSLAVWQYTDRTRAAVEDLRDANAALTNANDELSNLAARLRRTLRDTTSALSHSIDAKDSYTGGHTERVSDIAMAIAARLGFEGEELEAIEMGAILHDVGKIAIPDSILTKPGPLNDEEWAVMKTHPVISEQIVAEVDLLHPFVRQIARSSHERIDGTGYPDRLAGDAIPLPARIVLVADAWDALTSDRSYRRGRPMPDALAEIEANTGTQFCPIVVEALRRIYVEQPSALGPILRAVESRVA